MTGTIFDLFEEGEPKLKDYSKVPDTQKGYMEIAANAPTPKDDSFFSTVGEYGKSALKGLTEGAIRLGRIMGPLQGYETTEDIVKRTEKALNKYIPNENEGFGQKSLRRGLAFAPTALASPGSTLGTGARTLVGGFAGETAKELGAPEWLQTAAELTAYMTPEITKKILSAGNNKELIKRAKEMGFSDEQIAPLLQSDFKQKWLAKISPKSGSVQEKLKSTKSQIDKSFDVLSESPVIKKEISEKANGVLINDIRKKLSSLPRELQEAVTPDLNDLLNNKITGNSLMNFWKDLNHHFANDRKALSILKEPVKNALKSISPQAAKDFEVLNNLYSKYYPISSKLKPDLASKLVSSGEYFAGAAALTGLAFGHVEPLVGIIGEQAVKQLAKHMLTSPRLQQMSRKTVNAINDHKVPMTLKMINLFSNELKKNYPEISKELEKISEEDLISLFETSVDQSKQ